MKQPASLIVSDHSEFWPLAPIWWLAIALTIILIALMIWFFIRQAQKRQQSKRKEQWLTHLQQLSDHNLNDAQWLSKQVEFLLALYRVNDLKQIQAPALDNHLESFNKRFNGQALRDDERTNIRQLLSQLLHEVQPWN